jgi:hypothetical protein
MFLKLLYTRLDRSDTYFTMHQLRLSLRLNSDDYGSTTSGASPTIRGAESHPK